MRKMALLTVREQVLVVFVLASLALGWTVHYYRETERISHTGH
jgi:hypothetical protein